MQNTQKMGIVFVFFFFVKCRANLTYLNYVYFKLIFETFQFGLNN